MAETRTYGGYTYERAPDGSWVRQGPSQAMPADPSFQYEGPQASADLRKTEGEIANDAAKIRLAREKFEATQRAKGFEPDGNGGWRRVEGFRAPLTAEAQGKLRAQLAASRNLLQRIKEVEDRYSSDFKGGGVSGLVEYLPGTLRPENQQFDDAGRSLMGDLAAAYGLTAQQQNTVPELEIRFGPFIPKATDRDDVIEAKIRRLKEIASAQAQQAQDQLGPGGLAIQNGNPLRQDLGGQDPLELAGGDEFVQSVPIPPEMQAEYEGYVLTNRGRLDPEQYAQFRAQLQDKYGFGLPPDLMLDVYREEATRLNRDAAASGGQLNLRIPPVEAQMGAMDRINNTVFNSRPAAFAEGVANFHGGLDEAAAGVKSLFTGEDFDKTLRETYYTSQAIGDVSPGLNVAGNVVGGIATGYGGYSLAPKLFTTPLGISIAGPTIGATQGALAQNNNRAEGATIGGLLGLAAPWAGRAAAPVADVAMQSRPGQAISGAIRQTFKLDPQQVPDFQPGARQVANSAADLGTIRTNLEDAARFDLPYSLADADPKLRSLAGSAVRRNPNVRAQAVTDISPRQADQAQRAFDAVDTHLAPITDIAERSGQLRQAGSTAASPLYAASNSHAAPVDPEIAAFLRTETGKTALKRARKIAEDEGRDPMALGFADDSQGNIFVSDVPSFETLDYVKRAVDAEIYGKANPVTGRPNFDDPEVRALDQWRKRYVAALDRVNPDYAAAREAYQPFAQQRQALEMGTRGPGRNVRERDLNRITGDMSPEQLGEYRRGYATTLGDIINDRSLRSNPYDAVFGATSQQQKIGQLFPEGSGDFGRIASLERDMADTAQETIGGSPTAQRLQSDQVFNSELMDTAIDAGVQAMTTGNPMQAMRTGMFRTIGDMAKMGVGKRGQERAQTIGDLLLKQDPEAALAMLDDITAQQVIAANRRKTLKDLYSLGGVLAVPALAPAMSQ